MQFKSSLITFITAFAVANAATVTKRQNGATGTIRACTDVNFAGYCEDVAVADRTCVNLSSALTSGGVESIRLTSPEGFYCFLVTAPDCPVSNQFGSVVPGFDFSPLPANTNNQVVSIRCRYPPGDTA